ncbi:MAG TPA: type II CAAX endopeptidase family protein [Phycisphaerae bacterium]|nr:type II CAAX endopeptidase family protein [Phycisphaerae bacterium]
MTDDVEQRVTGNASGEAREPSPGPAFARRVTASTRLGPAATEPVRQSAGAAVADAMWVLLPAAAWVSVAEKLIADAVAGSAGQPLSYSVLLLKMAIRLVLVWGLIAWRLRVRKQRPTLIGWTARNWLREGVLGLPTVAVLLMVSVAMTAWLLILWPELLSVVYSNRKVGLMETFPKMAVWQWIVLPIVVAAIEEPFFRGLLQQRLTVAFGHPLWGVIAQAALFGAPHLYEGPTAALTIFYLGVILGALTWWRRSLVSAMVAHALFNMANFGLIHFLRGYGV